MRAFVIPEPGSTEIELAEVPIPKISDEELLVKVHAIGVGIHDSYFLPADAHYPYPIGIEAAGVVTEVGSAVVEVLVGDRVAFVSSMQPKGGTWAEFVAVRASSLVLPIPTEMEFTTAAAVPVAGNTILRAFHALDAMRDDAAIFIAGGSGAIGTLAIQLARQRGWRVISSASPANHDYLRSLGADAVDYHNPEWANQVLSLVPGGVDAAIAVQPGTSNESITVVKDGGSLISISGDSLDSERGIHVAVVPFATDVRSELLHLLESIVAGTVRVEIERTYPFEEALDALARVQTRHVRGKLVIAV